MASDLEVASIFKLEQRFGARLAVRFRSKEARDDAAR